jgi:hypothetical protein
MGGAASEDRCATGAFGARHALELVFRPTLGKGDRQWWSFQTGRVPIWRRLVRFLLSEA